MNFEYKWNYWSTVWVRADSGKESRQRKFLYFWTNVGIAVKSTLPLQHLVKQKYCFVTSLTSVAYSHLNNWILLFMFRARPDRLWGPPSLLYNGYRVYSGGKEAGVWRWPPAPSSAEFKEIVELYLYSPYGPSWPVLGRTLPLLHSQHLWIRLIFCFVLNNMERKLRRANAWLSSFVLWSFRVRIAVCTEWT